MRRLAVVLALLLPLVSHCKSEMEFVKEGKKADGASKPEGADAVPGAKTPAASGSGTETVVGDDNFQASTDAPAAEVVTDAPGTTNGATTVGATTDDGEGGNPGAATDGPTAGATTGSTTAGGATDPTTAGGTTDPATTTGGATDPTTTTGGATDPTTTTGGATDPTTTTGGTTASPTTAGTTVSPTTAGTTVSPTTATASPTTTGGTSAGATTGTGSGPTTPPTQTLVVDWGALVRFRWKLPGSSAIKLNIHSDRVPYDQDIPVDAAKDLPNGAWDLKTDTLEAGPYVVTLTVTYPAFTETYKIRLRIRPLLSLLAADAAVAPTRAVPYQIIVDTPAGADRVRLYLNDGAAPYTTLLDRIRGRHPSEATPDLVGANLVKGTIIKNGVRGRPATLTLLVGDDCADKKADCPQPPAPPPPPTPNNPGQNPNNPGQNPNNPGQNPNNPGQNPLPPTPQPPASPEPPTPPQDPTPDGAVPIALHLVNALPGTCNRLEIRGPVGSTDDASGVNCHGPDNLYAWNDWFAAKQFKLPGAVLRGKLHRPHVGPPLPRDVTSDGVADFPLLDFAWLRPKVSGTLLSSPVAASTWHPAVIPAETVAPKVTRNVVIVGTKASPFRIDGDVLIEGDLIIKGVYTGAGTIYVSGNIYIPHDIVASNSAFPFSTDASVARAQGKARVDGPADLLALVAGGAVFAGDNYPQYANPYTNPWVQAMYGWYPGGKAAYKRLYEPVWNCKTNAMPTYTLAQYQACDCHIHGGFSLIESSLYAAKGVYGASGSYTDANDYVPNSYAINGAVLTPSLDIITTPDQCLAPSSSHPQHKYPQGKSYLSFDWRLPHGARAFSWLKPAFKAP